jgi:hypothetical protein
MFSAARTAYCARTPPINMHAVPAEMRPTRRVEVMLEADAPIQTFDLDALQRTIDQLQQMIEAKSKDAGKRRA